jgi:hypothetical protein
MACSMFWLRVEVSNEHVGCKLSGLVHSQPTQGWPQMPPVVFASKTARQALQGWDHRQSLYLRMAAPSRTALSTPAISRHLALEAHELAEDSV